MLLRRHGWDIHALLALAACALRGALRPVAIVRAMSRIPYLRREELGPEGQQLWDAIVDGRSDLVVTAVALPPGAAPMWAAS